jgi:hypothetical protein
MPIPILVFSDSFKPSFSFDWSWWIFYLMSSMATEVKNPLGLWASASLRGILLGAALGVKNLRTSIDDGQYNSSILKNYQSIVAETELKPIHLWWGDNIYNWT